MLTPSHTGQHLKPEDERTLREYADANDRSITWVIREALAEKAARIRTGGGK